MRRLVIALVLVVLGTSACGGWRQDDAAQVNGVGIDGAQLQDDTRALLAQPAVSEAILGTAAALTGLTGLPGEAAPEGRLPTSALSSLLDRRIIGLLSEQELAARGVAVEDADRSAAEQALRDQIRVSAESSGPAAAAQSGQSEQAAAEALAAYEALPAGVRERLVRGEAAVARLRRELAGDRLDDVPGDARAYYDANREEFEEYCLSVVPVADQAEGQRLAAASASGQLPLGDLVSLQNGQPAGCGLGYQVREQLLAELGESVAAAPAGRAVGPFSASDGRQVLVGVTSRTLKPFAEVEADAARRQQAARAGVEDGPFEAWLAGQEPEITIDPRYGRWDAESHTVRTPEGTHAPDAPNPEVAP